MISALTIDTLSDSYRMCQRDFADSGFCRYRLAYQMAGKARRARGKSTTVPDTWLEQVRVYKTRTHKTLKQIAIDVSQILGRPIAHTTVHDYIVGRVVTEELTLALATLMEVPPPAAGIAALGDAEVQEWCDLGRRFKREHADAFRRELAALREVVTTIERYSTRRT